MSGFKEYNRLALFHLFFIACLGFFLRLKLEVPMPWVNQKFLLNGHSHFAFIAWVSFFIMVYIVNYVYGNVPWPNFIRRYFLFYIVNVWAMLIAFVIAGYAPVSLFLLSIHIGFCIWFTKWWILADKRNLEKAAITSISWALLFNLLSFVGTVFLALLVVTKSGTLYTKQNAVYIFLHYQYNGYFLFGGLGLFLQFIKLPNMQKLAKYGIVLFAIGTFTSIGLLILVREKPFWLNMVNTASACVILVSTTILLPTLCKGYAYVKSRISSISQLLLLLSFCGFVFKTVLQILSAIPTVAYMVYEHRSIAIGYLHLVFLIIVTFLFLGLMLANGKLDKRGQQSLYIFVVATVLNEIVLGLQGFGAIINLLVPYTNIILIVLTGLMAISMGFILNSYRRFQFDNL